MSPSPNESNKSQAGVSAPEVHEPIAAKRERFVRELRELRLPPRGNPDRANALRRFNRWCKAHIRELKNAGYTLNTVKKALTDYRNEVSRVLDGDELKFTLRYFTLTRDEWWALRRDYEAKVTAEAQNTRPIDAAKVLQIARENLGAAAYTRQAAALMVLTGRRSIEVLKLGGVKEIPGKSDAVLFSGQAKTKEIEVPPYEIPVLAPPAEIVAAWAALRAKKDFSALEPQEVNARCAKSLNETVEAMYGTCAGGQKIRPKDLRAIYALICCETLKPIQTSRTVFLATILGHRLYDQEQGGHPKEGILNRSIADSYEDFHLLAPLPTAVGRAREPEEISDELVGESPDDDDADEDAAQVRGVKV